MSSSPIRWLGNRCWLVLVPLLVLEAGATVRRNRVYQHEVTIWQDTVAKRPDNHRAWTSLGAFRLHKEKDPVAAQTCFERALRESARLDPTHFETRLNLSRALAQNGHLDEAIAEWESLVRVKPDAELYNNLGALYGQQGRLEKAGEAFRAALQLDPTNASARDNDNKLRAYLKNRSP